MLNVVSAPCVNVAAKFKPDGRDSRPTIDKQIKIRHWSLRIIEHWDLQLKISPVDQIVQSNYES